MVALRGVRAEGVRVRLLVVMVVTLALLAAAAPVAISQAPRLGSPVLALVAFGVAGIALLAGLALLVRAALLGRRAAAVDEVPADDSVTEPRSGADRIALVPTAGRLAISVPTATTPPRHARDDEPAQDQPVTRDHADVGGEPHTHAQASSPVSAVSAVSPVEEAMADPSPRRSAAFSSRYTAMRSRR